MMTRHAYGGNRTESSSERPYINIGELQRSNVSAVGSSSLPRSHDNRTRLTLHTPTPAATPSTCFSRPLQYVDFKQFDGSDDTVDRRTFLSATDTNGATYTNVTPRRSSSTEDYMLMTGSSSSSSGLATAAVTRKRVSTISGVVGRTVHAEFACTATAHLRSHSECLEYPSSSASRRMTADAATPPDGYLRMNVGSSISAVTSAASLTPLVKVKSRINSAEHYMNHNTDRYVNHTPDHYVNHAPEHSFNHAPEHSVNHAPDHYVNYTPDLYVNTSTGSSTNCPQPFENLVQHEHHLSTSRLTNSEEEASSAPIVIPTPPPQTPAPTPSKPGLLSRLIRRNSSKKAAQIAAAAAVAAAVSSSATPPSADIAPLPPSMLSSVSENRDIRHSNVYHPIPTLTPVLDRRNTTRRRRSSHDSTPSSTPSTARRFTGSDILSRVPPAPRRAAREDTPPASMAPPLPRRVSTSESDHYVCMTPALSCRSGPTPPTSITSSVDASTDLEHVRSRLERRSRIHSGGGVLLVRDTSSPTAFDSGVRVINADFDALRIVNANGGTAVEEDLPAPAVPMKTYRRSKSHPINHTITPPSSYS